ncbi:MAG: branched-chain amino acid ABC transporter permease [Thermodesulfobacteriota bacterium]|nr:branched-chain amino acid ABC transporter permease [Thermodesulfobacteriota bacterium]
MSLYLPCGVYNDSYENDMAIVRTKFHKVTLVAFLILLLLVPQFLPREYVDKIIWIAIMVIGGMGIGLLTGYCGQITLGHSAFVAVGAYTSAILINEFRIHFLLTFPLAGLMAGLLGVLFGLPALRVKGFYLILTTLAAQFIIIYVIKHADTYTGGTEALLIPFPKIGGKTLDTAHSYYYIAVPTACLMVFFARNITRSKIGRIFVAIKDNDLAAEVMGVRLFHYKLMAFFIGCFFAGIAGAVLASKVIMVDLAYFSMESSIWYLGILVIGGMGSIPGIIMGVVFIELMEHGVTWISPALADAFPSVGANVSAAMGPMIFGSVVVLFLVFEPRGLYHMWQNILAAVRVWPFSY